jgi:hypothetical protein
MKFLHALRTPAKVKDATRMFQGDGVGCRLLSQAYRTDYQGRILLQVAVWLTNEQISAASAAKEMLDTLMVKTE